MNKLNLEKFKEKFHPDWWEYIKPWLETEEAYNVYQILKEDGKREKIFPQSKDTFKALKLCPPDKLKLIIMAQDPYVGEYYDSKLPQADGMSLSNSYGKGKRQPSLELFLEGISNEFGCTPIEADNLTYLAEQGVLLANRALTVKKNKIGSHQDLWDGFWKFFLEDVLPKFKDTQILFLGKEASKLKKYVFEMLTPIHILTHPSASARGGQTWETNKTFTKINTYIEDRLGRKEIIIWNDDTYAKKQSGELHELADNIGLPF